MGAGHNHNHQGRRSEGSVKKLKIAFVLTFIYMLAEAVGGWLTNSLALLADAGHMFTDVAALALTLAAIWFAARPATPSKTYGYYRLEILAAFVNGIALVLLSLWIIYEGIERWQSPPEVKGMGMIIVAIGGLIVNIIAAGLLHGDHKDDLNIRGAWLHVIGDMLGSVAAIIAGIVILAFGWIWADAVTSILISLIIIYSSWRLILESVNVLLEGTPRNIDLISVEGEILDTNGVIGLHDLHVWTISSGIDALSAHITHDSSILNNDLLTDIRKRLHDKFGIDHLTIQMEAEDSSTDQTYQCDASSNCFESQRTQ